MSVIKGRQDGLFVSSTGTEIGKTIAVSGISAWFKAHMKRPPQVWKPVQSGVQLGDVIADSYRLKHGGWLTNVPEKEIVSSTFRAPLAPMAAARREQSAISYTSLIEEGRVRMGRQGPLLIEGAGGVAVPFTPSKTMAHLAADLGLPMMIVAAPLLGTISHTVTAIHYARYCGVQEIKVVIGGVTPQIQDESLPDVKENAAIIEELTGVPVLGIMPWLPHPVTYSEVEWRLWREEWVQAMEEQTVWTDWLRQCLRT
ncbi:dethiobiotin synthase [Paenibacillus sp. ACRRX]|uniref:dethiobiotin synthase n=1 Tax=Paenibacillus sp. ACRRX TaxID=2918206 RepID=UPI001EF3D6BA|nr:dethiobiotin synthase [Paenibacillus sp. ACRRX]MCG7408465.1 dethiobiotin synthase [Paenibacillus sp. ACRRX]